MQTRIQKWGNSLALRIPKAFATEVDLFQNALIELTLEKGRIIITPTPDPEWTLAQLLAEVTEDNIHAEVDTGMPVGKEIV